MSHHKDWKMECKVYVGDLGYGAAKQELEDIFGRLVIKYNTNIIFASEYFLLSVIKDCGNIFALLNYCWILL